MALINPSLETQGFKGEGDGKEREWGKGWGRGREGFPSRPPPRWSPRFQTMWSIEFKVSTFTTQLGYHVTCFVTCWKKTSHQQSWSWLTWKNLGAFHSTENSENFGTGANGTEILQRKVPEYHKCNSGLGSEWKENFPEFQIGSTSRGCPQILENKVKNFWSDGKRLLTLNNLAKYKKHFLVAFF